MLTWDLAIQVEATAGEVAGLPAIALRAAPVRLFGSEAGGPAARADAATADGSLLQQVATGEIILEVDPCRTPMSSTPGRGPAATGASSSCPDSGR